MTSNRGSRKSRSSGLSYQACAVIIAVGGMCAWVAHDFLAGTPTPTPAAAPATPGQAGDVYVTAPQAAAPPVVLMVAPDGTVSAGVVSGAAPDAGAAPSAAGPGGTASSGPVPVRPSSVRPSSVRPSPVGGTGSAGGTSGAAGGSAPALTAGTPSSTSQVTGPGTAAVPVIVQGRRVSYQVLAADGSIVYVGADGQLVANTGAVSSSGVLALGSTGSDLRSGRSVSGPAPATPLSASGTHRNDTFGGMFLGSGPGSGRSMAISGFEDHSVSVVGDDQVVTYDDSNVFLGRDGQINANTGDTDSSGLNAVDVTGSVVRSGNSGDAEDEEGSDEEEDEEGSDEEEDEEGSDEEEDEEDEEEAAEDGPAGADEDEAAGPPVPATGPPAGAATSGYATVTDEGASSATGPGAIVVGADGFDDVSIRSRGQRNVVTYDDSNVVIGGSGPVNTQIGDSDTGGAVVMGVHGSDVRAGCEGDLCYSD
ncbi:hypothetical protein ACH47X_04460 [Promicromonospora kroppenstedtii]|uniref:Uncharacterized protein n=1 Tax=Promicromonospora kroppenstedtii TaxID=440482 RepID=A0ABW7XF63_9MICO